MYVRDSHKINIICFQLFFIVLNIFYSIECLSEFKIYDATLYKNKPNLERNNIKSIPVIYERTFFGNNKNNNVLPEAVNIIKSVNMIKGSSSNLSVLDIERWPVKGSKRSVDESVTKYINVIENIREKGVKSLLGYYGFPPVMDYWRAIQNVESTDYLSWQQDNNKVQPLADVVDVLFPSLYTFYSDQEGWKKYAIAQIAEARRLGRHKPIIVFLWPNYHNSNKILKGRSLSTEFWHLQLDTAKKYADGIIIWGGWQQDWNGDAAWWHETLQFMKDNNLK